MDSPILAREPKSEKGFKMFKQIPKRVLLSLVMAAMCLVVAPALAADAQDVVLKGDAKCMACHGAMGGPAFLGIGRT